jgi:dTDP-4-dehydrorhamnose 3,5-epimerase
MLKAAKKSGQTVTATGESIDRQMIDGVRLAPLTPVLSKNGATVELFRSDGPFAGFAMRQVNYCTLRPGVVSDWHMHRGQNDVVIPLAGEIHVGLYDDRDESPTTGGSMVLRVSPMRMAALYIPCGVWHALKSASPNETVSYVVMTDNLFMHADPDDWRLTPGEPKLSGIL